MEGKPVSDPSSAAGNDSASAGAQPPQGKLHSARLEQHDGADDAANAQATGRAGLVGLPASIGGSNASATLGSTCSALQNSAATAAVQPRPDPDDKLDKVRAINRASQARYRQKQKERKQQQQEQLVQLAADLEREKMMNGRLRHEGSVLQAVGQHRDQLAGVLQAAAAASQPDETASTSTLHSRNSLRAPTTPSSQLGRGAGGRLVRQIQALPMEDRVDLCARVLRDSVAAQQVLLNHHGTVEPDACAMIPEASQEMGQRMVEAHPQLMEALVAMTPDLLLQEVADLGDAAADLIQQLDSGRLGEAEAEARFRPVLMYKVLLRALLMAHNPECCRLVLTHTKLPGETEEEEAARWAAVAKSMRVSYEQCIPMLPIYQTYYERMAQLASDAAAAMAIVGEVQQSLGGGLMQELEKGLGAQLLQYLKLCEATGMLSRQPDLAMMILLDFCSASGREVSILQKARMMAASRPLTPDVPCIVREGLKLYGLLPLPGPPVPPAIPAVEQAQAGDETTGGAE